MWRRALWLATGLGALGLWLVAAVDLPPDQDLVSCPLRGLTGWPCPGCGMTRALLCLARGEWRSALAFHPLSPLIAAEAILFWIVWGLVIFGKVRRPGRRAVGLLLAADAALLIAVWLGRLWTGTLPW